MTCAVALNATCSVKVCEVVFNQRRQINTGLVSTQCRTMTMTLCIDFLYMFVFQAVEELLEFLELEKSSYHMGLSRASSKVFFFHSDHNRCLISYF